MTSSKHSRNGKGRKEKMISKSDQSTAVVARDPSIPEFTNTAVKDLVQIFKLLSDETRLRVLLYLSQREELHVRALCERLRQNQPAVSHHLALLRMSGLVESRREGKRNYYRVLPHRFQQLLETMFAKVPEQQRRIRFENYVLSYAPRNERA